MKRRLIDRLFELAAEQPDSILNPVKKFTNNETPTKIFNSRVADAAFDLLATDVATAIRPEHPLRKLLIGHLLNEVDCALSGFGDWASLHEVAVEAARGAQS